MEISVQQVEKAQIARKKSVWIEKKTSVGGMGDKTGFKGLLYHIPAFDYLSVWCHLHTPSIGEERGRQIEKQAMIH